MKIFGFAGWSGSGKTTLIEKLIPRFAGAGLRVSLIKHAHHTFDVDQPGQGFLPPPPRRRRRGAGHLVAPLGADARAARRAGAVVRGAAEAPLAVRPGDRRGLQVRADPEARGLAPRDRRAAAASRTTAHRRRGERRARRDQAAACSTSTTTTAIADFILDSSGLAMNKGLLSVDEALAQLLAGAHAGRRRRGVPTLEATGRVLARAQRSTMDVPPMDNSAMDGYAVRVADGAEARLKVAQQHHGRRGRQAARARAPRRASSPARRSRRAPTRS